MRRMTEVAFSCPPQRFQSLARKFRSNETTAPAALAAYMPSIITSPVVPESAAKMPQLWNRRTPPAKMVCQSKAPGLSWAAASFERF
jgi:hypothetical protein